MISLVVPYLIINFSLPQPAYSPLTYVPNFKLLYVHRSKKQVCAVHLLSQLQQLGRVVVWFSRVIIAHLTSPISHFFVNSIQPFNTHLKHIVSKKDSTTYSCGHGAVLFLVFSQSNCNSLAYGRTIGYSSKVHKVVLAAQASQHEAVRR